MSQDQQKPQAKARRFNAAIEESPTRLCQTAKARAPDFTQHLLSIPKGGPDDLLDGPPLNLRDVAW